MIMKICSSTKGYERFNQNKKERECSEFIFVTINGIF